MYFVKMNGFFRCCYAELLHFLERYCNLIFFSTPKKMCNATKKLKNSCFAYTQIWIQLKFTLDIQ